ncbi:TetR family transcriptional regulator [Corynebacterium ulceribovis]|uniref:TetR family transcriptional regulator n=1 Tax=Corynebacterium ulceribovis TaxID=487732 RepID=UPI0003796D1C|nr:TetR family transcriptional regulator [Corynebacterium ulceribovis]
MRTIIEFMQLSRETIVDAALLILDEYGLQDLSIRRLAKQLDVAAGAMYWHFPSKQALLGGIADRLLAPLSRPSLIDVATTDQWRSKAAQFADTFHRCLTSHRDGAEVVSAALATRTASADPAALLQQILGAADLAISPKHAAETLIYFILGATVDEQTAENLAAADPSKSNDGAAHHKRIATGIDIILAGTSAV